MRAPQGPVASTTGPATRAEPLPNPPHTHNHTHDHVNQHHTGRHHTTQRMDTRTHHSNRRMQSKNLPPTIQIQPGPTLSHTTHCLQIMEVLRRILKPPQRDTKNLNHFYIPHKKNSQSSISFIFLSFLVCLSAVLSIRCGMQPSWCGRSLFVLPCFFPFP